MNAYMDFICALLFAHQFNLLNTKSITYCMYILQFYVNTKYIDSYTRMIVNYTLILEYMSIFHLLL